MPDCQTVEREKRRKREERERRERGTEREEIYQERDVQGRWRIDMKIE